MAELNFPDFLGTAQRGYGIGAGMRDDRQQQQEQAQIRALAPQIVGGDLGAYQQAAAVDPAAAQQLQGAGDVTFKRLAGAYKLVDDAKKSGNVLAVNAALKQTAPFFSQVLGKPVPTEWTPDMDEGWGKLGQQIAMATQAGPTGRVQSTYIDNQGQRIAIMADGSTQVLGQNAPNNQIIDTGNGFVGVNKGNLQAAPVMLGGQAPQAAPQAQTQGANPNEGVVTSAANAMIAAGVPEAQVDAWVQQQLSAPVTTGAPASSGQLVSAPKPTAAPAGYRVLPDGSMEPIPGGPAQVGIDARNAALEAKQTAAEAKQNAANVASQQRQNAAAESATSLITALDALEKHPGFSSLGTAMGDALINVPLIRNDAKDANASLKTIAGQIALTTMADLRRLSSQGATGFGALSAPELKLLENSITALQAEDISNAQLKSNLKVVKDKMEKIRGWKPAAGEDSGKTYVVGQTVEHNGKVYRVVGGDPADPDLEEVQ